MTTRYKYRYRCQDTNKWIFEWIDEDIAPTKCKHDRDTTAAHIITSVKLLDTDYQYKTIIKEDYGDTNGHYLSYGYDVGITGGTGAETNFEINFPHDIRIFSIVSRPRAENIGDTFCVYMAPDTVIGSITADASAGSTGFSVQDSVIDNIFPGFLVTITDGTNTEILGVCVSKDLENNTITVENALVNSYLASSPSLIKMTVPKILTETIVSQTPEIYGSNVIGGSDFPANTIGRLIYKNQNGESKKFSFRLEATI